MLTNHRPLVILFTTLGLVTLTYFIFLYNLPGGRNFGVLAVGILSLFFLLNALLLRRNKNAVFFKNLWKIWKIGLFIFSLWLFSFLLMLGLIYSNARNYTIENPDYLVILGAGLNGDQPSLTLQKRLQTGLSYLEKHPHLPVIVTGGQGPGETSSEAEAMSNYLQQHGLNRDRIILESYSRSTMENFVFTSKILEERGEKKPVRIMLITNDFHLLRSKILAERNGFVVGCLAAPTPGYLLPANLLREYFALIKSLLLDV
jgi:uncharacterized SAM-binding protein YcdF (DUF218 family)